MLPIYCPGRPQDAALHEFTPAQPPFFRSTWPKEAAMLFVAIGSVRAGTQRERIARRLRGPILRDEGGRRILHHVSPVRQ